MVTWPARHGTEFIGHNGNCLTSSQRYPTGDENRALYKSTSQQFNQLTNPPFYLSIISVHLSQSIFLPVPQSICLSTCVCLGVWLCLHVSICLWLSVCLSLSLFFSLSPHPHASLSLSLSLSHTHTHTLSLSPLVRHPLPVLQSRVTETSYVCLEVYKYTARVLLSRQVALDRYSTLFCKITPQ